MEERKNIVKQARRKDVSFRPVPSTNLVLVPEKLIQGTRRFEPPECANAL
jgi:hypothetical protein